MFGTGLVGLSRGLGFLLDVTISADELCDGDGEPLSLPYICFGEAGTGECTNDVNIFSIAQILAKSWIGLMFVELSGMG